jgi:aryl carrier-like protein
MFVRPDDVIPNLVSFNATQGCEDLVLLDDDMNIIPKHEGASGIIGIITTACATHYMGNEEATRHMFRSWGGDRILLYTDDIGNMTADGRITINGRRSRNVKINGLFVDMDHIERALIGSFPDGSVQAYKLVKSAERIVLFWSGQSTNMEVLKRARATLRKSLGDNLAMVVASTRYIEEMPYNASYKIDLAKLQSIADDDQPPAAPNIASPVSIVERSEAVRSRVDEIADEVATEVAKLSKSTKPVAVDVPLTLVGLNSVTVVQLYFWLQERYDYDDDMSRLFGEDVTAIVLARDITGEPEVVDMSPKEVASSSAKKMEIAMNIIHEVTRLTKSSQPVDTDVPLILVGINSITVIQLHFWLQSTFDYDGDMSRLFEENCSAEVLASEILGEDTEVASDSGSDVTQVDESVTSDDEVKQIAFAIATEVARLSKSAEPVSTDVPLMLAGLNSISVIQLHFWLQMHYEYEEEMSRLFEEDVTCDVVARDIRGLHLF